LQFDVISLTNVATLSTDPDIAQRAAMILDLLLYDIVIHSHKGLMASSRGRSYGSNKFDAGAQTVTAITKILSGGPGNSGLAIGPVVTLCIANLQKKYQVPAAVLAIAADSPEELVSFERIGIDPTMTELAEETDLLRVRPDDGMVWWGMEAYFHPLTFELAFVMGDAWDLYHSNETIFKYIDILRPYRNSTHLRDLIIALWPGTTSVLGPVFSYLYRTPDVALGAALSYRPGVIGFQQHAWQASVNGSIMVFTTQPGPFGKPPSHKVYLAALADVLPKVAHLPREEMLAEARPLLTQALSANTLAFSSASKASMSDGFTGTLGDDYADGYWTGSASMPRVGQDKDVLITIYNPPYDGEPKEIFTPYTHAYFPKHLFDDVVDRLQDLGWIAGRAGNAYVALYSNSKNITWQTKTQFADREIIAQGAKAVWVCVVGRQRTYGSFANFTNLTLLHSSVTVDAKTLATDVRLAGPGQGRRYTFGWEGASFVSYDNKGTVHTVPQDTILRLSSPYASVPFPPREDLTVTFGDSYVQMNFEKNTRTVHDGSLQQRTMDVSAVDAALEVESSATASETTASVAEMGARVARRIVQAWNDSAAYPHFQAWGYESGVIQLGLWELSSVAALNDSDRNLLQREGGRVLDAHLDDPKSIGYKIVHNEEIPFAWGYSIGDHAALYPVAYAARIRYARVSLGTADGQKRDSEYDNSTDLALVRATAKRYVLGYPHHLNDGTVSRPVAWWPDYLLPSASAVWADDMFMGTAVVSHALEWLPDQDVYVQYLETQAQGFLTHLLDSDRGLMHHGFNAASGKQSCCLWGRGNGWVLMALTDMLLALPPSSPSRGTLLTAYQKLVSRIMAVQGTSGLWHNLLNDSSTLAETSCTAFFTYAMATGVARGWLSRASTLSVIQQALAGLATRIAADGSVDGVIGETGIKAAAREYEPRSTSYAHAAPGLGALLRALAAAAALGL
jgi:hypothetical protein